MRHPKTVIAEIFGPKSNARKAMELKRQNPSLYSEIKAQYQHDENIPPDRSASPLVRMVQKQQARDAKNSRTLSDEELKACAMFSKDDCEALFKGRGQMPGDRHNAGNLKRESPENFRLAKIAAIIHGTLPEQPYPAPIAAPKAPEPDGRITVSDSLADELHIPRGSRIEQERLSRAIEIASEIKAAKEQQEKN